METIVKRRRLFFFAVLSLCCAISYALQTTGQLDPDVAWINYGVGRLLQGDKLYRDVVEINPPLIYSISLPPIWLARTSGWSENGFYVAWVLLIATMSSWISYGVLTAGNHRKLDGYFGMALMHVALITVIIGESFGQREHFLFMLLAPYVYLCLVRLEAKSVRTSLAACIGACAALGIALKPHYILVPAFIEILLVSQKRNFRYRMLRPEATAGLATAALIVTIVALAYPEFISEIVPLASRAYFPFYKESSETIWFDFATLLLFISISIYRFAEVQATSAAPGSVLAVAAMASALAMLVQFRGFPYQQLPTIFFLFMISAFRLSSLKPTKAPWTAILGLSTLVYLKLLSNKSNVHEKLLR